ncbi:hypothetical protein Tco_0080659 [Tanacetum coccineum]
MKMPMSRDFHMLLTNEKCSCKEFLAKSVDATKLASFRLSKCRFCSPGRKKKVRTRCSSQAPELHFVAENARVNNVNPEVPKGVDITARSRASSSSKPSHSRGALTSGRCFCDGDSSMEAAFDTSQDTPTTDIVESMTTNVVCSETSATVCAGKRAISDEAKIQASNVCHSRKQLAEALAVDKCVQM